ncbi:hypothetical protein QE152_g16110 [Popillia japonica]|uniref:Uncharacterized protein n=1 Tax=Popillia japonica TaxID=7064 RepID=A0AAW1L775_POPJA
MARLTLFLQTLVLLHNFLNAVSVSLDDIRVLETNMDKILLERARIAVRDVVSKYEDKTHYAKFIQERMVDTYGWYGWNVVVDPKVNWIFGYITRNVLARPF